MIISEIFNMLALGGDMLKFGHKQYTACAGCRKKALNRPGIRWI